MRMILATRNPHKVREFAVLLPPGWQAVPASEIAGAPEVEETGHTFEANAALKAVALARFGKTWALADDSGLEVDALSGAPGVYSARYAGPAATDAQNLRKLLDALEEVDDRRARYRCVLAVSDPSGVCRTVSGSCEGVITRAPRGMGGFGYDPVFVPEGETGTFAELSEERKHAISHRGRAMREACTAWSGWIKSGDL